jgi:hypothetical protein
VAASTANHDQAAALTLLLPERQRLAGDRSEAPMLRRVLARSDSQMRDAGEEAQLQRSFDVLPRGLPVAALTRQLDCADAAHSSWLRAEPAHLRADLGAGRMLGCGEIGLRTEEAQALVASLRPLLGDEGFPISMGVASRWYLMLPADARLPAFSAPARVLGDDIYPHLPDGESGKRWRRLLNEAQIILHQHPVNAARAGRGEMTANSLWFWGAGKTPDHVRCGYTSVCSDEPLLQSLAKAAGVAVLGTDRARFDRMTTAGALVDLRALRDAGVLERDWIIPALQVLRAAKCSALVLDSTDGLLAIYRRSHRWRWWRSDARLLK